MQTCFGGKVVSAVLTTQGVDYLLRYQLGLATPGALVLRLFTNDITPDKPDWPTRYTECTLPGYAKVPLDGSQWYGSSADGVATYDYPAVYWTFQSYVAPPVTVYGYYVTDPGNSVVVWAERFASPIMIPNVGRQVYLALRWIDQQAA